MIQVNDGEFYNRVVRRTSRLILLLGAAGAVGVAIWKGAGSGVAFMIGSAVSFASFSSWRYAVDMLVPPNAPAAPKKRSSGLFAFRLLALIAVAWVIIKFLGLNVTAAVLGLLVSGAAVILELIYELIYAS